jgi:SAM-dependent methyltransferase
MSEDNEFIASIEKIYSDRQYDVDVSYSEFNPVYLHRVQSTERAMLKVLNDLGYALSLGQLRVLDFGCGNGRWLGKWLSWGVTADKLYGVDIRRKAISAAKTLFSDYCQLHCLADRSPQPWPDGIMDICFANLVFTSMLTDEMRQKAANYILKSIRPGGIIIVCDFIYKNPNNKRVRLLNDREVESLFQEGARLISAKKIILAPPIARYMVNFSWAVATVVESLFVCLRTHKLWVLRKHDAS